MQKQYLSFQIKSAKDGELTIVASDETLDRMGEVIPVSSWDLKNYKKNPVLLVDHDYRVSNIVGRANSITTSDTELTFSPEFHGLTQLSKEVEAMVKSDFAPAVSVGFMPHPPAKDGGKVKNELLEISFVAVPANPNALALAMKSINDEQIEQVKEWMSKAAPSALDLIKVIDPLVDGIEESITKISDAIDSFGEPDDGDEGKTIVDTEKKTITLSQELYDRMDVEIKEGRVLSGKSRTLITECSTALKQAATLLDDLLVASEPAKGKDDSEQQGRDPKVEQESIAPKKAKSAVARALQDINRISRDVLTDIKDEPQS